MGSAGFSIGFPDLYPNLKKYVLFFIEGNLDETGYEADAIMLDLLRTALTAMSKEDWSNPELLKDEFVKELKTHTRINLKQSFSKNTRWSDNYGSFDPYAVIHCSTQTILIQHHNREIPILGNADLTTIVVTFEQFIEKGGRVYQNCRNRVFDYIESPLFLKRLIKASKLENPPKTKKKKTEPPSNPPNEEDPSPASATVH